MDRLSDLIYLSGQNEARDPALLRQHGIRAVCNLTPETDNLDKAEFAVIRLDQHDGASIDHKTLDDFLIFMADQVGRRRKTLIHCAAGVSRTGAFAIAWLMAAGLDWHEAFAYVNARRPIQPHGALKDSVESYFAQIWALHATEPS